MSLVVPYRAELGCTNPECGQRYPLQQVIYRCQRCDSLLDVVHDMDALAKRAAGSWIDLFERRWCRAEWPFGSGVWGKKEWVLPQIQNENVVSMFEGGTNLFWAERLGRELGVDDLWIKLCGNSHTGSFKDLGMTVLVSQVKQMRSDGQPIPAVACASTGDTSAALAAYCAAAGIPSVVLLPRAKVSAAQLVQPLANGALVLSLDTDFDGCMAIVQRLTSEHGIYLANSMNPLRIEGQKTVAIEIVQQMEWRVPDFMIIPGGNLGNVSALGKGLDMMLQLGIIHKRPRLVCAQAARANPLFTSYKNGWAPLEPITAGPTAASAIRIGNPVSFDRAVRMLQAFDGIVTQASEDELAEAAARADRTGTFCCPHTGVALAGLFQLIDQRVIQRHHQVVVISTAHGLKFTEFKTAYHQRTLNDVQARLANLPVELPASTDAAWGTIERFLERSA
jgi:threonine synthase